MNLVSACAALALATLAPALAHAAVDDSGVGSFHPILGAAITAGGDNLATVRYTNGDTRDLDAGGLVAIYGGVEWRENGSPFAVQGTVGYHVNSVGGRNGSVRFERFPIELLALWSVTPHVRLGAGARYATGARLTGSGAAEIDTVDFQADVAPVVMAEWLITPRDGVQLRYVHETYKADGLSFDGSHVGVGYNHYF